MKPLPLASQVSWKIQQTLLKSYLRYWPGREKTFFVQYHLPRTAGTTFKHAIRQQGYSLRILTLSHGESVRGTHFRYQNLYRFGIIRHPLHWYMSMYNIKIASQLTKRQSRIKNYATMADNSLEDFFQDLVLFKHSLEGIRKWNKPWQKGHVAYEAAKHYYPQFGFLTNLLIYYYFSSPLPDVAAPITPELAREKIAVDKILLYRDLASGLKGIFQPADISITLEENVKSSRQTRGSDPSQYFSPRMIAQIKERDRLIFELFYPQDLL